MQNARLDEAQAEIETAGRSVINRRYADDTTLMVEMEEELKSLLMKVREESEKSGLKFNILRIKIMASSPIQFSYSVVSDSLQPHELQHASLPVHHQLLEFTQTHVH